VLACMQLVLVQRTGLANGVSALVVLRVGMMRRPVLYCVVLRPCRFLAVGTYDCAIRILSLEDGNQMRAVATQSTHTTAGPVSTTSHAEAVGPDAACTCPGSLLSVAKFGIAACDALWVLHLASTTPRLRVRAVDQCVLR
jgi:hypothetical protein